MRRAYALFTIIALGTLYVFFQLVDLPLADTYEDWLPQKFNPTFILSLNDYEDPILSLLNTSEPLGNATYDGFAAAANSSLRFEVQLAHLNICSAQAPNLVGPIRVWLDAPNFENIRKLYPQLAAGGHGAPAACRARHRVAIIVPYRDREEHLRVFLHNLHAFLLKQQLDYGIFIVEPIVNQTFNRAKLMNVGFAEANRLYNWQCYIFHDVDLLPLDDRNIYSCPVQPRHMSVAIDKFNYKLPYKTIFGGAGALTKQQMYAVNGWSNSYFGWGGEDDDM